MDINTAIARAIDGRVPLGVVAMATPNTEGLKARQQELVAASETLRDAAETANRQITDDELEQILANADEAEKIKARIVALERIEALVAGPGRRTQPDGITGTTPSSPGAVRTVPATARVDQRTGGFRHLGDFAACVHHAARDDEGARGRLLAMGEGTGEDGGFLVPAEFRDGIMKVVEGEDGLLTRTDQSTTVRNAVTHPKDETTPWGTSGIQVYWEGEAQAATASGAKFKGDTLRLNKLFARVDVTDELLEDAPQLDNFLRVKAPEVMTSTINLAIVQGNGVGKPLGFMSSGALVTIPKFTSQPADTLFHNNIVAMWSRMYAPCRARSVWLINQDVEPQLHLMSFRDIGGTPSTLSGTGFPVYVPPGGLNSSPYGMLMGRPVISLQAMETLGDLGDIALVDLSMYRTITKTGGARVDTSIHLKFDTDETVYRFIFRLAGSPWWSAPIVPRDNANNTLSPFVTLATR